MVGGGAGVEEVDVAAIGECAEAEAAGEGAMLAPAACAPC